MCRRGSRAVHPRPAVGARARAATQRGALSHGSRPADGLARARHVRHCGQGARPAERPACGGRDQAAAARRICARPARAALLHRGVAPKGFHVCKACSAPARRPGGSCACVRKGAVKFGPKLRRAGPQLFGVREAGDTEPEQPAAPPHRVAAGGAALRSVRHPRASSPGTSVPAHACARLSLRAESCVGLQCLHAAPARIVFRACTSGHGTS
jgi:hypothetical protein